MSGIEKGAGALVNILTISSRVTGLAEAAKKQQEKIENLTGRIIGLEALSQVDAVKTHDDEIKGLTQRINIIEAKSPHDTIKEHEATIKDLTARLGVLETTLNFMMMRYGPQSGSNGYPLQHQGTILDVQPNSAIGHKEV